VALFHLIKSKLGDSRLFTVGIGSAPNSYFISKAAKQGRGTFTYMGDINEVQQKMEALFIKLDSPILKNIHINFNTTSGVELWPKKQPDLYKGEPIIVVAKSSENIRRINVSVDLANRQWRTALNVSQSEDNNDVAVLWARYEIKNLMDRLYEEKDKQAVKK